MRIISQGGHADLPYEQVAICMACEDIMARLGDKEYLMGRYKTMEQAEKVMDELHEEYGKSLYSSGGMLATANFYAPPFGFVPPKVFRFPKAEDVE